MDKCALGKARVASLDALLHELLGQDETTRRQTLGGDQFTKDGIRFVGDDNAC